MKNGIVKTLAFVLRRMEYGETSKIVTLYSRDEGKVSVLAKGARSKSNRFGVALEPGSLSTVVYYRKATRELQTLTQADLYERRSSMTQSMETIYAGLHALDIVHTVTHTGDPQPELFDELHAFFRAMDDGHADLALALVAFRLKVFSHIGLTPSLATCVSCGRDVDVLPRMIAFDVHHGGIVCELCSGRQTSADDGRPGGHGERVVVSAEGVYLMRSLLSDAYGKSTRRSVGDDVRNELRTILRLYERRHVFNGRTLRSESMVQAIIR